MNLASGTRLGRYEIRSKIGEGGMGEVYLAQDTKLDRKVAIKILPATLAGNNDRMRRFVQEAKAASALNHPNIITIYEIDETESGHFLATEFIDGVTLRERIRKASIKPGEVLDVAAQIASALSAAHAAGIVHRDVKPENIMMRADGIVKVLDFGLAKLTERLPPDSVDAEAATKALVQTEPGVVMGTTAYMSPEQARGLAVDARTDIFSLGVVIYELIAGRTPFGGTTRSDLIAALLEREPPPLARFAPEVPAELERIVMKALAKDPDERFQTAKDLLIDLKRLKQKLDVAAEIARTSAPELSRGGGAEPTAAREIVPIAPQTDAPTAFGPSSATSSAEYLVSGIKQHKLAAAITLLLLVIGAVFLSVYLYRRNTEVAIDSIAVLPFVNASDDPDTEYLSDGITESLINSFSQLQPKLRVIPRNTVFRYKGQQLDPQEIGRKLGVRALLTGRVTQHGDNVNIQTELIDVDQESQLWGEQYNRRLSDIMAIQEEITNEISEKLRLKLSGEEKKRLTKRYTENPEAYQLYLKGVYHAAKFNKQELDIGFGYLRQAVALDPNYALAYHGLSYYYYLIVDWTMPPHEAMPEAKKAALKAIEIDDTLAVAHADLGAVYWYYDWNWPAAEKEFKRAIELDPNDSLSHEMYGWYLVTMGRVDEGISEAKRSQQLDPLAQERTSVLGWDLYLAHRYDEAIEQHRKAIELEPQYWPGYSWVGHALAQKGRWPEAIEAFQKAIAIEHVIAEPLIGLGHVYAVSGKKEEARKVLDELNDRSKYPYVSSYLVATIYTGLGDKDQAFASLERAYEDRSWYMTHLKLDPELDSLHSDPRFADLVRRVGLPQ
jgi:eukaryotic-like serine/threonine-protein kinase